MSHLVLARKWRPRDFETLVGQQHVVRALTHALSSGRLHHAYLLTGTRGVGKTTIARILAKAINCETGPTPRPCGQCSACNGIDAGRFVDYVEMDAASNRGVDEMTQLLENAVYAPAAARYKVYVIDEVHMLSTHAFNAMLKTLEEPPPHVLFVLATTDPQKVPATVLSRCLQFNLKNMAPQAIADHLARVLEAEGVTFEAGGLRQLGRSAGGSMRDALSLLDQAIAFSGGNVSEAAIREMLGAVDQTWISELLAALAEGDGPKLIGLSDRMAEASAPFERVLEDLALWLHRLALAQAGVRLDDEDAETVSGFVGRFAPEDVQVYYQIVIHGARDLPLAPDPHSGFSMLLLRLLAFAPIEPVGVAPVAPVAAPSGGARPSLAAAAASARPAARPANATASATAREASSQPAAPEFDGDWPGLARRLGSVGLVGQFMEQSELIASDAEGFSVRVPIRPLADATTIAKVRDRLTQYFGRPVRLKVEIGKVEGDTAARQAEQARGERLDAAREAIDSDPFVQTLVTDFGGRILPDSVSPARGTS